MDIKINIEEKIIPVEIQETDILVEVKEPVDVLVNVPKTIDEKIKEKIPEVKDGKTPTKTEIKAIVKPLIPTAKEIAEIVLPKIPKPKDGEDGKSFRFSDLTAYEKQILTGPQGSNGVGVPRYGTTGQKLVKVSSKDFDTEWIDDTSGVQEVVAGINTSVDSSDPTRPIVSSLSDRYKTTSTTSHTIVSTGTLTFTVDASLAYTSQQDVIIAHNASNHMHGQVNSYSGTTLVVDITHKTGSGTYASWTINLDGVPGSSSPLTTKGDLYTYSTTDARLPVGTNGWFLTPDSAETTGLKWFNLFGSNNVWSGTQTFSQMTQGSVPFFGSNGLLSQDNTGFYYDDANNRLSLFTTVGSEVINNGTFTGSATGWTLGTGWAYSSNAVNKSSNGTATLSKTITLAIQREYVLTYTISNWTVGSVTPALGGFTGTTVSANGTYTERFVATSSSTITFTPTNTARFTIDSVSVKPLIGTNTRSNLNVGGLSVEGSWSNGTPGTTRSQTFNNDGSYTWTDYRFAGTLRVSTGANSSGGYDVYTSGSNGFALYTGNSGLTSTSLYSYNYSSGFVHYGFGYFGGKVNVGSTGTPTSTLTSQGSFATKGRRVTSNYTVTADDSVIYADASAAACTGIPTYSCSHWTNQTDCEKWDAHGGCSWFSGNSCSVYNGDQGSCQGQSGCTYDTASCSGFGDESTCNSYSGCSWSNNPQSCSGFDESTCSMTSGCSVDTGYCTNNYAYCSWDGSSCSGGTGCDSYGDESSCTSAQYWSGCSGGGSCSSQGDESSCSSYSFYNGCSGSYDNYSCSGDYYTGNCSGTYGAQCQGSSSCSGIDDSTNCGFETGCTWATAINLNLPSVVTVPNMHLWIYNDSSTNADVVCQPYSGDTIDKTTSYTLGTYKDAIHAQAFSELTSCSPLSEGACTPSGCSVTYTACSWDSGSSTCSGNAVCDGIGDQSSCESTTYYSGCSGNYYTVKNWYLLSRS